MSLLFILLFFPLALCQTFNFYGTTGMIYSPNYPKDYDNSANYVYIISVPDGNSIHLTFLDFLSEDPYDSMAIQSGTGPDAVTLQNYSAIAGDQTGLSVIINSTEATLVFTSDLTTTFRGFAIKYDSVPNGSNYSPTNTCSSPMHTNSFGIVTSPNFPENYPDNIQCSYLLIAPANNKITLQFVAFNTEDGYDIVHVYDGSNNSYTQLGAFSGKKIPPTITSTGNTLYLFFQSDLVNNFSGFSALYITDEVNNEFRRGVMPQELATTETPLRRDLDLLKWLKNKKLPSFAGSGPVKIQVV